MTHADIDRLLNETMLMLAHGQKLRHREDAATSLPRFHRRKGKFRRGARRRLSLDLEKQHFKLIK